MVNRTNVLLSILIIIIVVLAGIMIYAFVIKPKISGYNVQKQTEGVQIAISYIVSQLQQNGFVQIPIGNQTLILVPYAPPQQQPQQETPPAQ